MTRKLEPPTDHDIATHDAERSWMPDGYTPVLLGRYRGFLLIRRKELRYDTSIGEVVEATCYVKVLAEIGEWANEEWAIESAMQAIDEWHKGVDE